jgi:hypothetical protein
MLWWKNAASAVCNGTLLSHIRIGNGDQRCGVRRHHHHCRMMCSGSCLQMIDVCLGGSKEKCKFGTHLSGRLADCHGGLQGALACQLDGLLMGCDCLSDLQECIALCCHSRSRNARSWSSLSAALTSMA